MHLTMIQSRTYTITLHTHAAFTVMNELRQRQELCDVVLCLEDQAFRAHKVVLAGCSPYLRAMFTNGMKETAEDQVEIHGVDPVAMEIILTFMYTGFIEINVENVQIVLAGASMLSMSSLRNVCCTFLQSQLDASNCLGIHSFADMYSCTDLENASRRFIYQHFREVIQAEEFFLLAEQDVVELLKSDQLQVDGEEEVYEAAVSWLSYDLKNRSRCCCTVLQHIRLALLDKDYLLQRVHQSELINRCSACRDRLANALRIRNDNQALALIGSRSQPQSIYVVGGRNSVDCQLSSCERYDVSRDRWVPQDSMSISRTAVGAAMVNGLLYAVGGECAFTGSRDDQTMYLGQVECYDPLLKRWSPRSNLNIPRSFIALASLGGYLYALGGENASSSYSVVERYNPLTDTWNFMPNMKQKRSGCGVAVCDGKLYVAGGYDKNYHTDRASVECFDPETEEWTFVAEMEKARSGLALVAMDHYIYAFGGRLRHTDQYFNIAERYNTQTHQWSSIRSLQTPRAWPAVAIFDNKIYVMGGFDGTNRLRGVEIYDPYTDSWTVANNMNVARAGCGAAVV
ncbi:kelch-like protein 17 isoform X2 [Acanthaster planci]|nr:kelch-like protein 17 isoform X2 [Acanthaster planci]XP_022091220.1 kelch-like protein 17 isoform X2 [Acanthaster planci]XP_022091221.1 kelch-like protein 17 isoform X2 [Acanthaster planci]